MYKPAISASVVSSDSRGAVMATRESRTTLRAFLSCDCSLIVCCGVVECNEGLWSVREGVKRRFEQREELVVG
jgi:hypothetical protein